MNRLTMTLREQMAEGHKLAKDHGAIYTYPEEDLWLEQKATI